MVDQTVRLGPGDCPDPETGARYFAALAFPGANETQARKDATAAQVASYLHEANRIDNSTALFEDPRLNAFVQRSPAWCKKALRTMRRRLRDRSRAAQAVRPWMREQLGDPHPPVPGMRKFSQRQIALYLCDQDEDLAAKFQKRVWAPSRPVLHLAIAYDLALSRLGLEPTTVELDLGSVDVIGPLVTNATWVMGKMLRDPRFGVSEDTLLRLEWVP